MDFLPSDFFFRVAAISEKVFYFLTIHLGNDHHTFDCFMSISIPFLTSRSFTATNVGFWSSLFFPFTACWHDVQKKEKGFHNCDCIREKGPHTANEAVKLTCPKN